MRAPVEELTEIQDIGEVVAASICDFFSTDENRRLINELRDAGLTLREEASSAERRA